MKIIQAIKKLKNNVVDNKSLKNISILMFGTIFAQIITISSTPLITRLFSPDQFGAFALFSSLIAILSTIVTLRYEVNIIIPKEDDTAKKLLIFSLFLSITISILLFLCVLIIPKNFIEISGMSILEAWLPWACLIGMSTAISTTAFTWLNRLQSYRQIAQIKVIQSVIFAIAAIVLGSFNLENGLLVSHIMACMICMGLAYRCLPKPSYSEIIASFSVAKAYIASPKYMLPTALVDVVTLQIPVVLISLLYSTSQAGQFSLAWKVLVLPASLVGFAIGQVFFQRFSALWPDKYAAWLLLLRTWKLLAIFGLLPLLGMIICGEEIFIQIFGPNWAEA